MTHVSRCCIFVSLQAAHAHEAESDKLREDLVQKENQMKEQQVELQGEW